VGGVHGEGPAEQVAGFGVGGRDDVDLSAPLGTFGNTGGHRQDIDSAGAYVVAGPEGEDLSHALRGSDPNAHHNHGVQTYVAEEVSPTLKSRCGGSGGRTSDVEQPLVVAPDEAATLSSGSHPNSNDPGRKREDDVNLIAFQVEPEFGQGADLKASETDVAPPLTSKNEGVPGYDRGVRVVEEPSAYNVHGENTTALDQATETDSGIVPGSRSLERRGGTVVVEDEEVAYGIQGDAGSRSGEALTPSVDASGMVRLRPPGLGISREESPTVQATGPPAVAFTKTHGAQDTEDAELWEETDTMRPLDSTAFATDVVVEGLDTQNQAATGDEAPTLRTGRPGSSTGLDDATPAVAVPEEVGPLQTGRTPQGHGQAGVNDQAAASGHVVPAPGPQVFESRFARNDRGAPSDEVPPLKAESGQTGKGDGAPMVAGSSSAAVRRLTPTECERLQGFPDGWSDVGGTTDGPRYSALGDAVTVNVAYWIVRRLVRRRELGLE
jgi:hypothetical protein